MSNETTARDRMREHLSSLLERAESTDQDWALTNESPLSVERSGKYVNVLFSTGGPHTEITVEYDDDEAGEYWFENEPQGAWFTYMDWGTREDVYIPRYDAQKIMQAIMRDPSELGRKCESCGADIDDYAPGATLCAICEDEQAEEV